jgi:hypothetical protein
MTIRKKSNFLSKFQEIFDDHKYSIKTETKIDVLIVIQNKQETSFTPFLLLNCNDCDDTYNERKDKNRVQSRTTN